eukprot:10068767-Ditylum_brightwellii.AAC.1
MLLQSYVDKFSLKEGGHVPHTPAKTGQVLSRGEHETRDHKVSKKEHSKYQTGVGKLLHTTQFTRPEMQNAVRECSKLASFPTKKAIKAMKQIMWYCVYTKKQGLVLKPDV